ncbi:hypothetical protein E4K72_04420 [Oxalobacteraceae bacterium OM1]|nr:hypothetical protein E4K72_04420 [Oxalobacteraceae bacterium OM1]
MKTLLARAAALALVAVGLGGCAVYGPPPDYGGYYGTPPYGYAAPAYPAPGYYNPAPVYWGPPVSFGFSFGYWGGGHGHHHRR